MIFKYLKLHFKSALLFCIFIIIFLLVFYLSDLPVSSVGYAIILCFFIGFIFTVIDFYYFIKKHNQLNKLKDSIMINIGELPEPCNIVEYDYQELIKIIFEDKNSLLSKYDKEKKEMIDYFTLWVHQIKSPIAAMRLLLQIDSSNSNSELEVELFNIEQYVEMVLSFFRLDSDSTDFVFKQYNLNELVKQAIRKYSKQFIRKKINLELSELNTVILTDEKWLVFVIEQILSNSLKYTNKGAISIYLESKKILVIKDTGIGIAAQDLPRVFEKGYTGYNGRSDKKATGIGLYLCYRIIKSLGHSIEIESIVDIGTTLKIDLDLVNILNE